MDSLINEILKVEIPNWKSEKDSFNGCIIWTNKNIEIYGTPFFDGYNGVAFEINNTEQSEIIGRSNISFENEPMNVDVLLNLYFNQLLSIINNLNNEKTTK